MGADYVVDEIPADMLTEAKAYREQLIEKVSEVDDKILEMYLHGEEIPEDRIKAALRKRAIESVRGEGAPFVPVVCGVGVQEQGRAAPARRRRGLPARHPLEIPAMVGIDPNCPDGRPHRAAGEGRRAAVRRWRSRS